MFEKEINIATKHLFRLDFTAWVLRRRDRNMLDQWDGRNCSRVVTINKNLVLISLVQLDSKNLVLKVTSQKRSNTETLCDAVYWYASYSLPYCF